MFDFISSDLIKLLVALIILFCIFVGGIDTINNLFRK